MEQDRDEKTASRMARTARALEILTAALVILVSPVSFVASLPFHIAPETWLRLWLRYVFIFVILAVGTTTVGLGTASSYRVRVRMIRRSMQKRG